MRSPPNATLLQVAAREWRSSARLLDIGCGAGRNALPLALTGWEVIGHRPLVADADGGRRAYGGCSARESYALVAGVDGPTALRVCCFDFIVAHGIWNLARSSDEFRQAVREAARVARPGCALFLFTFSRGTLPEEAEPLPGESFVFTQFSGQPQCFLTEAQLVSELAICGFEPDPALPLARTEPARERRAPVPFRTCDL